MDATQMLTLANQYASKYRRGADDIAADACLAILRGALAGTQNPKRRVYLAVRAAAAWHQARHKRRQKLGMTIDGGLMFDTPGRDDDPAEIAAALDEPRYRGTRARAALIGD